MSSTVLASRHSRDDLGVWVALGGFLAGYSGHTHAAYRQDLRLFTVWCTGRGLPIFEVRRAHIELFARSLERQGRARATIARRLSTIAGFYRYCVEEELITRTPAVNVRRPKIPYESAITGLDRNELGGFLVEAGLAGGRDHALACLLALNGLRVSEALGADIEDLGMERGHPLRTSRRPFRRRSTLSTASRRRSSFRVSLARKTRSSYPTSAHGASCTAPEPGADSQRSRPDRCLR